jgi:hypothetical protein
MQHGEGLGQEEERLLHNRHELSETNTTMTAIAHHETNIVPDFTFISMCNSNLTNKLPLDSDEMLEKIVKGQTYFR